MPDDTPLVARSPILRLVRGQPLRRPSAADLIAASALPADVRVLVADVVRRTGGRRGERSEIARELLAHFDDALRGEQPPDRVANVIAEFGDPATTATLLRRAMLRKRGPISKSFRWAGRGVIAATLLLAVGYGVAFARFHASKPIISFDGLAHLRGLTPRGEPEERAWPLLRAAVSPLRTAEQRFYEGERAAQSNGDLFVRTPEEGGWSEAAAIVKHHRASIDAIRDASRMPVLGAGIEEFDEADHAYFGASISGGFDPAIDGLLFVRLPYLSELRRAARWLGVDGDHALVAGDASRFVADIEAMIELGRLSRGPFLVDQLVSAAILAMAFDRTLDALAKHPDRFDRSHLVDLANHLDALPEDLFRLDLRGEQSMMADFVQRVYSDDGAGDGHLVAHAIDLRGLRPEWKPFEAPLPAVARAAAPVIALAAPSRKQFVERFDEAVAAAERRSAQPTWEWRVVPSLEPFNAEILQLFGLEHLISANAYGKAVDHFARLGHQRDLARLAIALAAFRGEEGAWPSSLDEIVPRFLAAIPADPYDGKPLRYALVDGRASIWSIGPDRVEHGPIEDERYTEYYRRAAWTSPVPPTHLFERGWPDADLPLWTASRE